MEITITETFSQVANSNKIQLEGKNFLLVWDSNSLQYCQHSTPGNLIVLTNTGTKYIFNNYSSEVIDKLKALVLSKMSI